MLQFVASLKIGKTWNLFLLLLFPAPTGATTTIQETIGMIEHDLGFMTAQEMCNKDVENIGENLNNAKNRLEKLVTAVEKKMDVLITSVTKLRDEIERTQKKVKPEDRNSNETSALDCCKANQQVNISPPAIQGNLFPQCVFQPSNIPGYQRSTQFSEEVANVIRNIYKPNLILRQYYAKPSGAMVMFPPYHFKSCDNYDPRKRSWYLYTESTLLRPKDIVIVIDTSRSMEADHIHGLSLMELARRGAQMVLDTLTPSDRVAIVGFSDEIIPHSRNSCYSEELAVATQYNKRALRDFIGRLRSSGQTNYMAAINKAVQYFESLRNDKARDKILLFISDGRPTTGGDETEVLKTIQSKFRSNLHIMTVGISMQDNLSRQLLRNMARWGQSPQSRFIEVNSSDEIVKSLRDSYTHVPSSTKLSPVFIPPYMDAASNDVIMSVCLPIRNQALRGNGITCVDVNINNVFKEIIDFEQGETYYAFLINNLGNVIHHPRLPKPSSQQSYEESIDIEALERDLSFNGIVEEMTNSPSGQKNILAQLPTSRGDPEHDGSDTIRHNCTYTWVRITKTKFTVCAVFRNGQKSPQYASGFDSSFIYHHNTSKFWKEAEKCYLNNRLILKDRSTVEFPSTSFKDLNVTQKAIDDIARFMRNESVDNLELQLHANTSLSLRDAVAFTAKALPRKNENTSTVFVWRYMTAAHGIMRVYPGIKLNTQYDARKRDWYQRTLNNKDKLVFSGPYLDYWGSGHVISITKAICKDGCERYSTSKPLVAVIGGDVTLYHLYDLLIQNQDQCQPDGTCVIIDSSGNIVLHYDFIYAKRGAPTIESVHISVKEPEIAKKLIDENILRVRGCLDAINNMKYKYFWQIFSDNLNHSFENFNFQPIHHTNLFLIVKTRGTQVVSSPVNNCDDVKNLMKTTIRKDIVCKQLWSKEDGSSKQLRDCSCCGSSEFNHCKNTLRNLSRLHMCKNRNVTFAPQCFFSDFWPTCVAASVSNYDSMGQDSDYSDAQSKPCTQVECQAINNTSDCRRSLGCMWCLLDHNGHQLSHPFCVENRYCYYGRIGHSGPYNRKGDVLPRDDEKSNQTRIVFVSCAVGSSLIIVTVLCIACIYWQHKKQQVNKSKSELPPTLTSDESIEEIANHPPAVMWNPMYTILSVLSQHKSGGFLNSATNSSINLLTQKVDTLVERIENSNAVPTYHPSGFPQNHIDKPNSRSSMSIYTPSLCSCSSSWPTSVGSGRFCCPRSIVLPMNCPKPPHTSNSPVDASQAFNPASEQITKQTHLPIESTWCGSSLCACQICQQKIPSEHTCPCIHTHNGKCCNSLLSEQPHRLIGWHDPEHPRNPSERTCPCSPAHSRCRQASERTWPNGSCNLCPREPSERTCPCSHTCNSTQKCSNILNEHLHSCSRQASERTWPDGSLCPSQQLEIREPSERTCPCVRTPNSKLCSYLSSSPNSTHSKLFNHAAICKDNHPAVIYRTFSFRQQRTPTEPVRSNFPSRSKSAHSRRSLSAVSWKDYTIAYPLSNLQNISNSSKPTGNPNGDMPHPPDVTEQGENGITETKL